MGSTGAHDSPFAAVQQAPEDLMFGLKGAYLADKSPNKVDLGPGAYRDDHGQPFVLPVVQKAKTILQNTPRANHEYLPIAGLEEYLKASQKLVLGSDCPALLQGRVATTQAVSGTGALHLGALFLARFFPNGPAKKVWTTTPSYTNHLPVLHHVGLETGLFPYYSPVTKHLDVPAMLAGIEAIPDGSILLLHACAHNPTGVDPTRDQWKQIASIMHRKRLLPFFDSAYQGFATGDIENDVWPIRHYLKSGFETVIIAQSYAKNMGLYGERTGCLHVVTGNATLAKRILSQLKILQRVEISTPPAFGARIASTILNDEELYTLWQKDLRLMAGRIKEMREQLKTRLVANGTPGSWEHITDQIGMFCYSGLTASHIERLKSQYHVYATPDGRFSIAGLNSGNVGYVADAIHAVVTQK